jgi:hypothetical protein
MTGGDRALNCREERAQFVRLVGYAHAQGCGE